MYAIRFDHAAATPVDPRVHEAMLPFFAERHGDPSELRRQGREARRAIEAVHAELAALVGGEVVHDFLEVSPPIVDESRRAHPGAT